MAHTPGPWRFSHDEYAGHYDVSTFDPNAGSESISQVLYVANTPGGRGEGDARLIAAAPSLLEALRDLFASYKKLADSGDAGFWSLEDTPVGQKAIAAISLATEGEG